MFWIEKLAVDFPTMWQLIVKNNKSQVSNEMVAVIFFEETSFVNREQAGKNGPAAGFGQIEVGNRDKIPFYKWLGMDVSDQLMSELKNQQLSGPALKEKLDLQARVKTQILSSAEASVQMSCKYFQYLGEAANKDLTGIVSAQIGSHIEYRQRFQQGTQKLKTVMAQSGMDRQKLHADYVDALNLAKRSQKGEAAGTKNNPILEPEFKVFWDWVLPEEFLRKQSVN